ncbi:1-(5-phosphoribosyl)-5-[(5-phosphoribosylamino)methylideneamino]imidazole-4-carboxamide isomerase [Helicobacter sp. 12S02232-10]|uniref:1-(5-phosphoribosyl)-5-[(5- phosphoribosylamino)methylideneamino]imidazole-4- carboxamide isomerase n=1 Tax=Helicobacter sp. 12S02232-10 TaxID=1476197 RepID=UPI000BA5AE5C|nr:1-(5-phosphoribosyl)-5-[(5-phosphoribosylamino)methylideneamino]imidazole-4-carboxamide isomerase [Helicobacter sp. 12S02232-10]PAF49578.1 1-(5-phosphoribosyl)-5-[(5-phosphoribosylamino)methylideneamino]imidazole-4-carboxamide isomerase [Helicobacter sp. 12S02232-10]
MLEIFPAIDLKEGKAVRLYKGEMASAKIYGSARDFAKKFEDLGARWIHIVDLDGAFCGEPKNLNEIENIRKSCNLKIQLGGGIRNEEIIKTYSQIGIDRLILGSVAMKNPVFVKEMAKKYKIAVGIDSKNGKIAVDGWSKTGEIEDVDLAAEFKNSSIDAIICTDISRDGALSGVNVEFTLKIAQKSGCFCIASGGVKDENDLHILAQEFQEKHISGGVIVGKAYYEGHIDLGLVLKRFA